MFEQHHLLVCAWRTIWGGGKEGSFARFWLNGCTYLELIWFTSWFQITFCRFDLVWLCKNFQFSHSCRHSTQTGPVLQHLERKRTSSSVSKNFVLPSSLVVRQSWETASDLSFLTVTHHTQIYLLQLTIALVRSRVIYIAVIQWQAKLDFLLKVVSLVTTSVDETVILWQMKILYWQWILPRNFRDFPDESLLSETLLLARPPRRNNAVWVQFSPLGAWSRGAWSPATAKNESPPPPRKKKSKFVTKVHLYLLVICMLISYGCWLTNVRALNQDQLCPLPHFSGFAWETTCTGRRKDILSGTEVVFVIDSFEIFGIFGKFRNFSEERGDETQQKGASVFPSPKCSALFRAKYTWVSCHCFSFVPAFISYFPSCETVNGQSEIILTHISK